MHDHHSLSRCLLTVRLLCEEHDFSLFKVVLFKHVVDDFKIKAKEKR